MAWTSARQRYVVAVRCDFAVAVERGAAPQRADAVVAAQGKRSWRTIHWREGSKGWLRWPVRGGPRLAGDGADGTRRIGLADRGG